MPKISVIIPVYNTEKYLAECLDSVLAQTFTDLEIICVNDGSTDNSEKILQQYAKNDKRIKIISQKNSGVIVARNRAIANAKSEYIYPLDSDDIIAPDTLQKLYNAMIAGCGDIITCRVMAFGRNNEEVVFPRPTKYNMARRNCLVNAALFRKCDFEMAGGYDTAFNIALEDYDFWLNMVFNQHKKIYRVPEILFYYRLKDKAESRNFQHRCMHGDLIKLLFVKYPAMRKYILLSRLLKPFRKLRRFVFRIENHTIQIFKIPVYKIRPARNTNTPKIAVCFYGNLRTFQQCLPFVRKNLIDLYDCDVFMHTWDKYDHNSKTWHNHKIQSAKSVDKNKLKRLLHITDEHLIVEPQPIDDGTRVYHFENNAFSLFGLECLWHAMQSVNKLRQKYAKAHNINYDAVVFIRPDIMLNTEISVLDKMTDEKAFYYAGNPVGIIGNIAQIKASDIFFWAKPDVIDGIMKDIHPNVKNGQNLALPPEGLFIEKVIASGATPLYCADYKYGRDFWVLRPSKPGLKIPNDIIALHIRKHGVFISVLRKLRPILNITLNIFNGFAVDFSIGHTSIKEY